MLLPGIMYIAPKAAPLSGQQYCNALEIHFDIIHARKGNSLHTLCNVVRTWVLVNSVDVHSLYTNIGCAVKIEDTISSEGFRNCIIMNSISSIKSNCSTTTPLYVMIEKQHKSYTSISSQDSLESVYLWK